MRWIRDHLPLSFPLPVDPRRSGAARTARISAWIAIGVILIIVVVQFQFRTAKQLTKYQVYKDQQSAGLLAPGSWPPKQHNGAVARWEKAVRDFWQGHNIYSRNPRSVTPTGEPAPTGWTIDPSDRTHLHPNMPFTVMLLTPFAYMPPMIRALVYNVLKLLMIAGSAFLAARLVNRPNRRMPDWVLGLALVWVGLFMVGDIQHGNTNVFVMGAIVLHVWLYRCRRDMAAGMSLALAICLKMTPALFVLYWLYQRNWRILGGTLAGLLVMTVLIPLVSVGPAQYAEFTGTWLDNMIAPGTVGDVWFPVHINQSLPGVAARYFLAGPNGDIFWNMKRLPGSVGREPRWITLVALGEPHARLLVRSLQALIVVVMAWAIGWRKIGRQDPRRPLHYALVLLTMMLLNQRTWDHHAAVLLMAYVGMWHAACCQEVPRRPRRWAVGLMTAAGAMVYLTRLDIFKMAGELAGQGKRVGSHWGYIVEAYGPTFWHFVLMFTAAVILVRSLRNTTECAEVCTVARPGPPGR